MRVAYLPRTPGNIFKWLDFVCEWHKLQMTLRLRENPGPPSCLVTQPIAMPPLAEASFFCAIGFPGARRVPIQSRLSRCNLRRDRELRMQIVPVTPAVRLFALIALAVGIGGCATAPSGPWNLTEQAIQKSGDPLIARLAEGGYVLYFRHGKTDVEYQDRQDRPGWWKTCNPRRHRPLSDEGRAQMETIGVNMRALRIPVAKVVTSEYCRAVDSGLLLQVMPVVHDAALNHSEAQRYAMRTDVEMVNGLRALFGDKPPAGKNTVLIGHVITVNPPLETVFTSMQEAEAVVLRPLGDGKYEIVGRVPVERWALREKG